MIQWRQLPAWLFRAWPIWTLLPVLAAHWVALVIIPAPAQMVNKVAGMLLQVTGGLLVLYAINDNLGVNRTGFRGGQLA